MPFPPDVPSPAAALDLPLKGMTLLVAEDSRFTCDALRLYCQRSGARLRRAETLSAARDCIARHPPDLVLVDLGLPDGRGEGLIADCRSLGLPVIGLSGDPDGRGPALAAGAAGFIDKPLPPLASFQRIILDGVLGTGAGTGGDRPHGPMPSPDPLALRDDLARAARLLSDPGSARYVAGFLRSLGRDSGDAELERAALRAWEGTDQLALRQLVERRLARVAPLA